MVNGPSLIEGGGKRYARLHLLLARLKHLSPFAPLLHLRLEVLARAKGYRFRQQRHYPWYEFMVQPFPPVRRQPSNRLSGHLPLSLNVFTAPQVLNLFYQSFLARVDLNGPCPHTRLVSPIYAHPRPSAVMRWTRLFPTRLR